MSDKEISSNLIFETDEKNEECKLKCSHELDMKDENEHLTVIDAISVQTELEQLFNDFNIYNHHIRVFKKLLNLKELKNQYNFFAFNRQESDRIQQQIQTNSNELNEKLDERILTLPPNNLNSSSKNQPKLNRLEELNSTLFKDGELSVMLSPMQIHTQLGKIKEQFLESQLLVTCLIHNVHSLRKHFCGTALDLIASSELLANLERDHSSLKACKSIFKYQCNEKRRQLNKLKQQLKQAHEDWNQLIVKEPKITKLTNEELLLLNRTQKKRKTSIGNQWNDEQTNQFSNQLNNELDCKIVNQDSQQKDDNSSLDSNLSSSIDLNDQQKSTTSCNSKEIDKNQDANISGESNCDSAVHSESEDSLPLQELAAAIYRRKSKLDRLERECYSFMSRLANRNRTLNDSEAMNDRQGSENLDNNQFENSNLILEDLDDEDNFNDYANEYDDEDLLDEEYDDDVEFDEIINDDSFEANDLDIESLINRFSNVQTAIDTDEELINQNLEEVGATNDTTSNLVSSQNDLDRVNSINNPLDNIIVNTELMTNDAANDNNLQFENLTNEEFNRFSTDYLIGQSRSIINNTTSNYLNENIRNNLNNHIINYNESSNQQLSQNLDQQTLNNSSLNSLVINNEANNDSFLTNFENRSRLNLSNESLDSILDNESDELNTSLVPRAVNSNEDTTLAKTGEPIALCRLRRRAVKILASRIRTEKQYYEEKENELKQKLENLILRNEELEKELKKDQTHRQSFFFISTVFVFCSLISYFIQNFN